MGFLAGILGGAGQVAGQQANKLLELRTAGYNHMADMYGKLAENYKTNLGLMGEYLNRFQAFTNAAARPWDKGATQAVKNLTDPSEPLLNFSNQNVTTDHVNTFGTPPHPDMLLQPRGGGKAGGMGGQSQPATQPAPQPPSGGMPAAPATPSAAPSAAPSPGGMPAPPAATPQAGAGQIPPYESVAGPRPSEFHYTPWGTQEVNPEFTRWQAGAQEYDRTIAQKRGMFAGLGGMLDGAGGIAGSPLQQGIMKYKMAGMPFPVKDWTASYIGIDGQPHMNVQVKETPIGYFDDMGHPLQAQGDVQRGQLRGVQIGDSYTIPFIQSPQVMAQVGPRNQASGSYTDPITGKRTAGSQTTPGAVSFKGQGTATQPPTMAPRSSSAASRTSISGAPSGASQPAAGEYTPTYANKKAASSAKSQQLEDDSWGSMQIMSRIAGLNKAYPGMLNGPVMGRVMDAANKVGSSKIASMASTFTTPEAKTSAQNEATLQELQNMISHPEILRQFGLPPDQTTQFGTALGEYITLMRNLGAMDVRMLSGSANGIFRMYQLMQPALINISQDPSLTAGHVAGLSDMAAIRLNNIYRKQYGDAAAKMIDPQKAQLAKRMGIWDTIIKGEDGQAEGKSTNYTQHGILNKRKIGSADGQHWFYKDTGEAVK